MREKLGRLNEFFGENHTKVTDALLPIRSFMDVLRLRFEFETSKYKYKTNSSLRFINKTRPNQRERPRVTANCLHVCVMSVASSASSRHHQP